MVSAKRETTEDRIAEKTPVIKVKKNDIQMMKKTHAKHSRKSPTSVS